VFLVRYGQTYRVELCSKLKSGRWIASRIVIVILIILLSQTHVRWDPCPHSMARPRVADGGTASRYGG
jgi:hypothetical protein